MKQTYATGIEGEKKAEAWLREEKGMECLERRYRTPRGEIDLIMLDQDTIVFVEVKTRRTGDLGLGLAAVTAAKQKRIAGAAMMYLISKRQMNAPVRFDVVEVYRDSVIHVPDAFQSTGMFFR